MGINDDDFCAVCNSLDLELAVKGWNVDLIHVGEDDQGQGAEEAGERELLLLTTGFETKFDRSACAMVHQGLNHNDQD